MKRRDVAPEPVDSRPTTPLVSAGSHLQVRRFSLFIETGRDEGGRYTMTGERTRLGTHRSCQLVLRDSHVSRFHCELCLDGGRVLLRDLDSRNGTRVGGIDVREAFLDSSVRLDLGQTRIRFEPGADDLHIPLAERNRFGALVGRSQAMRMSFVILERAAASDATVLIQGQTGTGKELAAEAIHDFSARRAGPLVVVDCGAIPSGLFESELFGHEAGAFTGAVTAQVGAFEEANGGTLFLDEIGELDPALQPKLLRALETRRIRRVGGTRAIPCDVRIIAATNRDLKREVNRGRFRSDLYYRLAVIEAWLPPLADRAEDIPELVENLLGQLGALDHPAAAELRSEAALRELTEHPWPGNIRQLRNYLEQCLAVRQRVPLADAAFAGPPAIDPDEPLRAGRERFVRYFEREYLTGLLHRHAGNVTAAARVAGVDRVHLHRLLARLGLRPR